MSLLIFILVDVEMLLEEETLEEVGGVDNGEHKDGGQVDCETEFHNVTDLMDISVWKNEQSRLKGWPNTQNLGK